MPGQRYAAVIDAFVEGVERARAAGHDVSRLASVASFFSRVDTEIDERLDKVGTAQATKLRGQAAIANARLAFQAYDERLPRRAGRPLPTRAPARSDPCGRPPVSRTRRTKRPGTSWSLATSRRRGPRSETLHHKLSATVGRPLRSAVKA